LIARLLALLLLAVAFVAPARAQGESAEADARSQVLVLLQLPPPHYRPEGAYGGHYGNVGRSARRAVAQELARVHGLAVVTDWPLPALGVDCWVLQVPAGRTPADVAEMLARDTRVAWAQPMNVYRGQQAAAHDDPLYSAQPAALQWRLAELHALAGGRGVTVAVVDSGVDVQHPELQGQVVASENFVDDRAAPAESHGTAVAGIIAARAGNRAGIAGIAPAARVLALRGCWQPKNGQTLCTSLGLAKALHYALGSGASILNLSLGGPPDRLLARLLDAALARGIAVVASVDRGQPDGGFPASHPGVAAVSDAPLPGAIVAPGRDVPAPQPGARYAFVSGASYAAAHVAGLYALLRELDGRGRTVLVKGADGGIDACATLLRAGARGCTVALAAPRP
jgi:subtilisin family serine protease